MSTTKKTPTQEKASILLVQWNEKLSRLKAEKKTLEDLEESALADLKTKEIIHAADMISALNDVVSNNEEKEYRNKASINLEIKRKGEDRHIIGTVEGEFGLICNILDGACDDPNFKEAFMVVAKKMAEKELNNFLEKFVDKD